MSHTYMRKEKGDKTIVKAALCNWARYRRDGYVFVENIEDDDGNVITPEQQYLNQVAAANPAPEDDGDGLPTADNTKAEIVAYLEANGIEFDASAKKAELLELVV